MILLYHNNNHFNLIYDINEKVENECIYINLKGIKINENINNKDVKSEGVQLLNKYVECKFINSSNLYDEIAEFLQSCKLHKN